MKQACKYNIIRFQPYAETQEFANIGVVLYVPKSRKFVFKLLPQNTYRRITHFFSNLDKAILQNTLEIVRDELVRIQDMAVEFNDFDKLFAELVRPREGLIQYSGSFVRFTDEPVDTVNELFEHYVHHSFTKEVDHEAKMRTSITQLLNSHNLSGRFKAEVLGSDYYQVSLPFVNTNHSAPAVIKPIHFKHKDSTKLFEHGLWWLTRMDQLFQMDVTKPESVLFTFQAPTCTDHKLYDAYQQISHQIERAGIAMLDIENKGAISEFARKH